eukprot:686700-Hanusia_phi.AAC.1
MAETIVVVGLPVGTGLLGGTRNFVIWWGTFRRNIHQESTPPPQRTSLLGAAVGPPFGTSEDYPPCTVTVTARSEGGPIQQTSKKQSKSHPTPPFVFSHPSVLITTMTGDL